MSTPPDQQLNLRRKWTFRAHGRSLVVVKNAPEKASHVYMKAFMWALYLPTYPDLTVELSLGMRFKPDVVSVAPAGGAIGEPRFWGEAGQVALEKLEKLFRRFPRTHFAVAKWGRSLQWQGHLDEILRPLRRQAPVDFLVFPADAAERWVSEAGDIDVSVDQVLQARYGGRP